MCEDGKRCAGAPDAVIAKMLELLGPKVLDALEEFIGRMRLIDPTFAQGVDENLLLAVFCAGRANGTDFVLKQAGKLQEFNDHMTASSFAHYASEAGLDMEAMQASVEQRLDEQQRKEQLQ